MPETDRQKVVRLAEQGVERAVGERRSFTITKFGRHPELGYFHARVTHGGRTFYVHRKWGSWLAPGKVRGRELMKELEALGIPFEAKVELCRRARLVERAERGEESKNGQPENGDTKTVGAPASTPDD